MFGIPGDNPANPLEPDTGLTAAFKTDDNAPPADVSTLPVAACFDTSTAMMATPTIAAAIVKMPLMTLSLIKSLPPPKLRLKSLARMCWASLPLASLPKESQPLEPLPPLPESPTARSAVQLLAG